MKRHEDRSTLLPVIAIAAVSLFTGIALAAPGDLDPTFSDDGRATINFGSDDGRAFFEADVAVQPDGAVVVVGGTTAVEGAANGTTNFAIARLRSDGLPDTSFSDDGRQIVAIGPSALASAVALQADGKIVVAGVGGATQQFALLRLNADGSVDNTFGTGGVVGVDFATGPETAFDVAVQDDGKIVVVGERGESNVNQTIYDWAIARLNPDGSLDDTFGDNGKILVPFGDGPDFAFGVAIQPDAKIVVVGQNDGRMGALRLNPNGDLDSFFGSSGQVSVDFPGDSAGAYEVALQADGRIVMVGYTYPSADDADFGIVRLEPSGARDLTFGDDGLQTAGFGDPDDAAYGVKVQANGKIVVGGYGGVGKDLVLTRLNSGGSFDQSFGTGGSTGIEFGGDDVGGRLAIASDGQIVIAGSTGNNSDVAVARVAGDATGKPPPPGPDLECNGAAATIIGTDGADNLTGTDADDVIVGLGGNDIISGKGGNDTICGGDGYDTLRGGPGRDILFGEGGNDKLFGGGGKDKLRGGPGRDRQKQ